MAVVSVRLGDCSWQCSYCGGKYEANSTTERAHQVKQHFDMAPCVANVGCSGVPLMCGCCRRYTIVYSADTDEIDQLIDSLGWSRI